MTVAVPDDLVDAPSRDAVATVLGFAGESTTDAPGRGVIATTLGIATVDPEEPCSRKVLAEAINLALSVQAPRNLAFDADTNTLSWDAPDWLVPCDYWVRSSTDDGENWTTLVANTPNTSYVNASHTAGTIYEVVALTSAGLASRARWGGPANLTSVDIEGPTTVVERTTATFRVVVGEGSLYDSISYLWTVRAQPENGPLGTVTVAGDMLSITYAASEISLDRQVTVTCVVTARGAGIKANANSVDIETATHVFTQDHVPSADDPDPPTSVTLAIAADGTATVGVVLPSDDKITAWGGRITDGPTSSDTHVAYTGTQTPQTASVVLADAVDEAGTYYAFVRTHGADNRRSTFTSSNGVTFTPQVTTETQYAYRRAASLPALPTSTTQALPSGWSASSPGATTSAGVYRIARTVTRDGGTFQSATAWAWDPAQGSQPWEPRQSPALTVSVGVDGGSGARNEGTTGLIARSTVGGTATGTIGYQWSISGAGAITSGATVSSVFFRTNQVSANSSLTLTVTVTRGGHTATASVTITVLDTGTPATLTVSISGPGSITEGQTGTFTASVGGTATGPVSYSWSTTGTVTIRGSRTGSSVTLEADQVTRDNSFSVRCTVTRGGISRQGVRSGTVLDDSTTPVTPPPAPTGLSATITDITPQGNALREFRINASWTSGGGTTTRFRVSGGGVRFTTATSVSYTVDATDLGGTTVTLVVTAYADTQPGGSASVVLTIP